MNHLEDNQVKEKIHSACFTAIASCKGYLVTPVALEDDYGVDFQLKKLMKRGTKVDCPK